MDREENVILQMQHLIAVEEEKEIKELLSMTLAFYLVGQTFKKDNERR